VEFLGEIRVEAAALGPASAALRELELCQGVLAEMPGLAPAATSRHLGALRQANLLGSEKMGR